MNCWLVCLHNNCHHSEWEEEWKKSPLNRKRKKDWEKNERKEFIYCRFPIRYAYCDFKCLITGINIFILSWRTQQHMPTKWRMDNNQSLRMAELLLLSADLCKFFGENRWIPCITVYALHLLLYAFFVFWVFSAAEHGIREAFS